MPIWLHKWLQAFVEDDQNNARSPETLCKEVIESAVKRGAYYAHRGNLPIAMINNDNQNTRELGFRRILKARNEVSNNETNFSVRQFKVPQINVMVESYTELLHWETDHQRTKPPITKFVFTENLVACNPSSRTFHTQIASLSVYQASDRSIHESVPTKV